MAGTTPTVESSMSLSVVVGLQLSVIIWLLLWIVFQLNTIVVLMRTDSSANSGKQDE